MYSLGLLASIFIAFLHIGDTVRFTNGVIEWGTLCNLNATDFEPENVGLREARPVDRFPYIFPGLHELSKQKPGPTTNLPETKPCCFPKTWESGFVVYTRRIGRRSRGDLSQYRIRRHQNGTLEAVIVVGQTVMATSLCRNSKSMALNVCPKDHKECLEQPFLGEPRCISSVTGFHFISRPDSSREIWFTDSRIPTGGIRRHIYTFARSYGICQLKFYQVLTGQYVDAKRSCRLMFLQDRLYVPMTGSYQMNFNHSLEENLFHCANR